MMKKSKHIVIKKTVFFKNILLRPVVKANVEEPNLYFKRKMGISTKVS